MQIILVDDNSTDIFLAKRLFHHAGMGESLTTFLLPVEAVAYVQQQVQAGLVPELLLLDLNMPLMSGFDVLEALRPLETELLGRCAIYILTSSLAPQDRLHCERYPLVTGVLLKPLNRGMLHALQAQSPTREA